MNNYTESKIWYKLEHECKNYRELASIQKECERAIELMKTVRDTFPTYTLHDERHICNIISIMEQILGDAEIEKLTIGECAMLILVACYHDVGMCYTEEQRANELKSARFLQYIERNPKVYLQIETKKEVPEDIRFEYFRKIHHLRVGELMSEQWEINIVRKDRLVDICRSHGESLKNAISRLDYDNSQGTDYVLCAILLRLSDILDFDSSRAPDVLYGFQKINTAKDPMADTEWTKHMSSRGFKFIDNADRILAYSAVCGSMQDEHEISEFLNYIDEELHNCRVVLERHGQSKWRSLQIPKKVDRNIERQGYQTGEYCLTLEADNVLALLVGNDLYQSDTTFIRELMQNSLDAVRARLMIDRKWKQQEECKIIVSSWIDREGYQWFRIDDSGIGMTEQMIKNYFLRAGKSYYKSDEFEKSIYDNRKYYDFLPISQFGIGILSCFLKGDRMEISTRYYDAGNGIRFTMKGIKGYYSIAEEELGDRGTSMPSIDIDSSKVFRQTAGTSIAIRIKESLSENIMNCLKSYVCFPDVGVCYRDEMESYVFPTQQELMEFVKGNREIKIPFDSKVIKRIEAEMPEIIWEESPYIYLKCIPLDEVSGSEFISGADFAITIEGKYKEIQAIIIDEFKVLYEVKKSLIVDKNCIYISLFYELSYYKGNNMVDLDALKDAIYEMGKESSIEQLECFSHILKMKKILIQETIPFSVDQDLKFALKRFILPRCISGMSTIENHKIENVYNGICVEVKWEDLYYEDDRYFRYTVLLLSKRFKPKLGISRDSVQYIPIEAAGYIELLAKKIKHNGISCKYFLYYGRLEFSKFNVLIIDQTFCKLVEEALVIDWQYQKTLKDIKEILKNSDEKIRINVASFNDIMNPYFEDRSLYFSNIILKVFLQLGFEISWDVNENNVMELYITGIRNSAISGAEQIFLPLTFVKSLNKNTIVLTEDETIRRNALNADHPFSAWLLKYAEYLYQNHKSLFIKIREKICILDSKNMISEINMLLKEIEKRMPISIPNDVWLKDSDFIKLWHNQ